MKPKIYIEGVVVEKRSRGARPRRWHDNGQCMNKTSIWEHHTYRRNAAKTPETQTTMNEFQTTLGQMNRNPL